MALIAALVERPGTALAVLALAWAGLQLVLSKRRDLGPMTIGLVTAALIASTAEERRVVAGMALGAGVLAAVSWVCGARVGVGRLALDGLVGVASLIVGLVPLVAGTEVPLGARLGPLLVAAAMAAGMALERPGPRRSGPSWYRRVPVQVKGPDGKWEEIRG